jgi:O-antigen ligase
MTLATVRTASRGGLVMLAVGLATALVLFLRKRRASAYLFLAPAALAGIAYTVLTSELVQARFEAALAGRTGSRLELAEGGWSLFLQKPWFGWGTAYVFELGAITGKERIAAHNTYLQILVSFGLLGFLPWFALLLTTGYNLWCHRRHLLGAMALALFVGSLVFSIVSNNGYNKTFWMSLGVATVVPAVLRVSPTKKVPSRWQKRGASIGSGRPSVPRFVEPQTTPRFWPRAG